MRKTIQEKVRKRKGHTIHRSEKRRKEIGSSCLLVDQK
jgi:hypothetical protein|uniref:Uncharacterized protein n=1 Tax=Arabidopsis thaliana TaxID=3702 RepID=Q0WM44_ARATH|nr:hypothetical protein [Arabidopsis thaliana]